MNGSPIILSWSGGKDSTLALAALRSDPNWNVVGLLTSLTTEYDRVSIHGVRRKLLEQQAQSIGLPLYEIVLVPNCSNQQYECAFTDSLAEIGRREPAVRHIAFGDLFLTDVRAYRERLLAPTTYEPVFPIWGLDTKALARQFVRDRFRARIVCVDTEQLDASFAGSEFDMDFLERLPASADPCGEKGEFHTFVSDGPIFKRPIEYAMGETVIREGRFAYTDLVEA